MAADQIPDRIKRFLAEHVHTYEELEVVVLLHTAAGLGLTCEAIAERLPIPVTLIDDALKGLHSRGIVSTRTDGDATYYMPSAAYNDQSGELAALYAQQKLEVVMLMSANAIDRVRTGAMRTFADCFFVARKRKDG